MLYDYDLCIVYKRNKPTGHRYLIGGVMTPPYEEPAQYEVIL